MITFREMVDVRYLALGFTKKRAFAKIYTESEVSISALEHAYGGTRVTGETVRDLVQWMKRYHPKDELDQLQLLTAPTKSTKGAA